MESDRLLSDSSPTGPQSPHSLPSPHTKSRGCCGCIKQCICLIKETAITLYHAFGDPRTGWGAKIILGLALMLAITPFDFVPVEGPFAAIFDFTTMPLLVYLSIKLIPNEVYEDAKHKAKSTSFSLTPIKKHWRLALCVYVFWTMQFVIMAKVLPHPLHVMGFEKASVWVSQHRVLLTAIFLGLFNLKCLIVVVVITWRSLRQRKEAHQALEASLIYSSSPDMRGKVDTVRADSNNNNSSEVILKRAEGQTVINVDAQY
ncbi:hypothetical protein DUNSADRAFT_4801 [Dunaliella salina]|uniref:Uncharacterized protein n=1 Tax=Dunaliella salina TaxID=3046 RepID=A0ABQ7GR91_DUNSA|nr:hypothetical protein DUNSADRAFT_4801 [Dunaliella salina]|eukprot:KAF5837125.1 hypothetical protein DUNSADRAFT_4801 [Dunaliella salina]